MKPTQSILLLLTFINFNLSFGQLPDDTIQNKIITLGETVISANKVEETKKTVAQQIQVLSARQIASSQSQTTADLIASTGNVFVQKSQLGGGSPVIRGFEASRILLVVDGVRLNNIIYRSGHLQNVITLDNTILERAEILFGPSSTIYGSDALGGVIHFYTKKPLLSAEAARKIKANALVRYGSVNDEITGHADFNIGGRKFASLSSFTYSRFDDLRGGSNQNPFYDGTYGERPYYVKRMDGKDSLMKNEDRYLQVPSGYSQYDLLQKFAYKQDDRIIHGLNIQFSNSTDVPRYDRLTDPDGSGLRFAEWYYGPQRRLLTAYDLNIHDPSGCFRHIHAGVNYQNIEESRHTRRSGSDNLSHRTENVNVIGVDVDFNKVIRQHNLRFGLDAQFNALKSTAGNENIITGKSSPLDTRYPDGDNRMTHAALYFSHTWTINDELTLTNGVRLGFIGLRSMFVDTSFFHLPFTEVTQRNGVYSGSAGIIHTPTDDLKLSFLLSTGFRAPNVDDLSKVFESAPGQVIVPNPDLKPEKTVTTEIGIAKIVEQKASWENTVYYTRFLDAIVTDKFLFSGEDSILYDGTMSRVLANQNKRNAYLFGFSSSVMADFAENLLVTITLNYTYGRIKTDSSDYPLDHIPPLMARMQLGYTYKNFTSEFFINYNGWKRLKNYYLQGEDNEQYATPDGMPAWFTLNLRASYKIWKYLTLQAGVDNILDTQYRTFASGINAPGRNIFAAVRWHY